MPITVFHRENNSIEEWLEVNDDLTVTYHVENSGWPMMRGGTTPRERTMSIDEAKRKWPSYVEDITEAATALSSRT